MQRFVVTDRADRELSRHDELVDALVWVREHPTPRHVIYKLEDDGGRVKMAFGGPSDGGGMRWSSSSGAPSAPAKTR